MSDNTHITFALFATAMTGALIGAGLAANAAQSTPRDVGSIPAIRASEAPSVILIAPEVAPAAIEITPPATEAGLDFAAQG